VGVYACGLSCHTAEDNAVEQRVAAETVVSMDASCNLAGRIQAGDLAALANDFRVCCDLKTAR